MVLRFTLTVGARSIGWSPGLNKQEKGGEQQHSLLPDYWCSMTNRHTLLPPWFPLLWWSLSLLKLSARLNTTIISSSQVTAMRRETDTVLSVTKSCCSSFYEKDKRGTKWTILWGLIVNGRLFSNNNNNSSSRMMTRIIGRSGRNEDRTFQF